MNKRSQDKQKKIVAVLDYAVQAFREKGYHSVGVQELSSSCGISKAAFFQYFGSKENFAVLVIDHFSTMAKQFFLSHLEENQASEIKAIQAFFRQSSAMVIESNYSEGCLYADLSGELAAVNEKCRAALGKCFETMASIVADCLCRAQQKGELNKDLEPAKIARFLMNSWAGTVLKMKVERSPQVAEEFIETFIPLILK